MKLLKRIRLVSHSTGKHTPDVYRVTIPREFIKRKGWVSGMDLKIMETPAGIVIHPDDTQRTV